MLGFYRDPTWEFPKIRGTLFWGPYNKDPTIWGTILGSPIFGNPHIRICVKALWMISPIWGLGFVEPLLIPGPM